MSVKRKWIFVALTVVCCVGRAFGQDATPNTVLAIAETGPVRERADVDPDEALLERLLPLDPSVLKISGEFREQFESWRNREFGFAEDADDDYLLQRLYLDIDCRPTDWFRAFTEVGSSFKNGSPFQASPIDEDPFYFQQLLADVTLIEGDRGRLSAQVGRQTFSLGSGRLVATRNGPNIRRSFDAARLMFENDQFETQLIVGSDVNFGGDAFDNAPSTDRLLWGSYSTIRSGTLVSNVNDGNTLGTNVPLSLDLYYLGYRNKDARFDSVAGDEHRHSFGMRFFGVRNGWDYNIEPIIQFGSIADDDIFAWTIANVAGYTFSDVPLKPRLGMKFDVISGDRSPGNGRLGTFNALYPNNSYFSEAAAFSPANLYDLNLNLDVELTEKLTAVVLWDFLWRFSTEDAIYVPPGVPAIAGDATDARYIGDTISIALEWRPIQSIETTAAYVHLEPGDAITDAGGKQADFVLLWATWFF